MVQIALKIRDVNQTAANMIKGLEQSIFNVKKQALERTRVQVKTWQAAGFLPTSEEEYITQWKNPGSNPVRRTFSTIRPGFLRIGTAKNPLRFTFFPTSSKTNKDMIEVARLCYEMAKRRVPIDSGKYRDEIKMYLGNTRTTGRGQEIFGADLAGLELETNSVIQIVPTALKVSEKYPSGYPYGMALEDGYYNELYEKSPPFIGQGVMRHIARKIQKSYNKKAAIRFVYLGAKGGRGTFPAIEIGQYGLFPSRNDRPGIKRRRINRYRKRLNG